MDADGVQQGTGIGPSRFKPAHNVAASRAIEEYNLRDGAIVFANSSSVPSGFASSKLLQPVQILKPSEAGPKTLSKQRYTGQVGSTEEDGFILNGTPVSSRLPSESPLTLAQRLKYKQSRKGQGQQRASDSPASAKQIVRNNGFASLRDNFDSAYQGFDSYQIMQQDPMDIERPNAIPRPMRGHGQRKRRRRKENEVETVSSVEEKSTRVTAPANDSRRDDMQNHSPHASTYVEGVASSSNTTSAVSLPDEAAVLQTKNISTPYSRTSNSTEIISDIHISEVRKVDSVAQSVMKNLLPMAFGTADDSTSLLNTTSMSSEAALQVTENFVENSEL